MIELRCLDCICAGCKIEYSCKDKPCDDSTNPYECTNVKWDCETYNELFEKERKANESTNSDTY